MIPPTEHLVEKKFLCVDQGPGQVLEPLAEPALGTATGEMGQAGRLLLGGRPARDADPVQLHDLLRIGAGISGPAGDPAPLGFESALEVGRVQEVKALREVGLGRPLALADALTAGAAR